MCVNMCMNMSINMSIDMYINMCMNMCIDICIAMCIDMCIDYTHVYRQTCAILSLDEIAERRPTRAWLADDELLASKSPSPF